MNDNTELQKVKERIAKLLRMADDASSPNEAAIAASRARKLMDKYQLDLLDIESSEPEDFSENPATRFYAAFPYHLNVFATAVAKYNDCLARFEWGQVTHRQGGKGKNGASAKHQGKRIVFQGYANDATLAVQMYEVLTSAVDRLCREYLADKGYERFPVGVAKEFKVAAILVISERLAAMTVERDRLTSEKSGTSLVLFKSALVEQRFGKAHYKEKSTNFKSDSQSYEARNAGRKAGRSVEIVKTVEMGD